MSSTPHLTTPPAVPVAPGTTLPARVDVDLATLRDAWLLSVPSPASRRAYAADLAAYLDWLAELARHEPNLAPAHPLTATRATANLYADALANPNAARGVKPFASSTRARKLAALTSFYGYAADEGAIVVNPFSRVRRPRVWQEPPLGLDRDGARALLRTAAADGPRAHALVLLLLQEGLRCSDALGIDLEDFDTERGHRVVSIRRKGGLRELRRVIAPPTAHAVDVLADGRTSGPLFVGKRSGERMAPSVAARHVARLAAAAGLGGKITPHSLRHTSATLALEEGVPLHIVQDHMGHADPRTTRRYDRARGRLDNAATYRLAAYLE